MDDDDSHFSVENRSLEYIFEPRTRKVLLNTFDNIRPFEWGTKEADALLDGIKDAKRGSPLQLGMMILVPMSHENFVTEMENKYGRKTRFFSVVDGQQRLTSITILLRICSEKLKQAPGFEGDAEIIAEMIKPTNPRFEDATRIKLGEESSNEVLTRIIVGRDLGSIPSKTDKNKSAYNDLSNAAKHIVEVYEYFKAQVSELQPEEVQKLVETIKYDVRILIAKPPDVETARDMVLGLSKGKNLELIDEFKATICIRTTPDQDRRSSALIDWQSLLDEVGRKTVQRVCLLLAQGEICGKARLGHEIEIVDKCLRSYKEKTGNDGFTFLKQKLEPAARAWHKFLRSELCLLNEENAEHAPSLSMLRDAVNADFISSSLKRSTLVGIPLLKFMTEHNRTDISDSARKQMESSLKKLETIALWNLLTASDPKSTRKAADRREAKLFSALQSSSAGSIVQFTEALQLSTDEKQDCIDALRESGFRANRTKRTVARILLERMNEHRGYRATKKGAVVQVVPEKEDTLGNLVVITSSCAKRVDRESSNMRNAFFIASEYPLTREAGTNEEDEWGAVVVTPRDLVSRHNFLVDLAIEVWQLRQMPSPLSQESRVYSQETLENLTGEDFCSDEQRNELLGTENRSTQDAQPGSPPQEQHHSRMNATAMTPETESTVTSNVAMPTLGPSAIGTDDLSDDVTLEEKEALRNKHPPKRTGGNTIANRLTTTFQSGWRHSKRNRRSQSKLSQA